MLNRKDPITAMIKLVDTCNQSSRLFFIANPKATNIQFQQLALTSWQKLNQFEFELKTELRRLGGIESNRSNFEVPNDAIALTGQCVTSLQLLLEHYDSAIETTLSAHARAMVMRQAHEIRQAYEKLVVLSQAA
jgi:hypothetical protein